MRVLVDAVGVRGMPRGVGHYVRELAGSMADTGEVRVVLAHGPWHRGWFAPLAARGVELAEVRLPGGSRPARHGWHALGLDRLARAVRADLIHLPELVPPPFRTRLPVVATIHDTTEHDLPWTYGPVQRRYRRAILRRQVARAAVIVTPSAASATRLADVLPAAAGRTVVVPHGPGIGVSVAARKPETDLPARFLLCVGAVQRHKNLPRVIEALRGMDAPEVGLVIAGADDNDSATADRAAVGDPRVHRLRDASDAEIAWLYEHAAALVFPSLSEGFGLPVLEAMSRGCPVITADRGAPHELAGNAGLSVDPLDTAALREALEAVLRDDGPRARMVAAGLDRARGFTWAAAAAGTIAAYSAALAADVTAAGHVGARTRS